MSENEGAAEETVAGVTLLGGHATGQSLRLTQPLSFWGGTDPQGRVTDAHHPQQGESLAGRIVVMAAGRGSSSSASVLAEQIRIGVAPAAILLIEADPIITAGALAAQELYGRAIPIVLIGAAVHARIPEEVEVRVLAEPTAAVIAWAASSPHPSGTG